MSVSIEYKSTVFVENVPHLKDQGFNKLDDKSLCKMKQEQLAELLECSV